MDDLQPVKLALRERGNTITAYIVLGDQPVEEGMVVGSIAAAPCAADPKLFETFKQLMKSLLLQFISDAVGDNANVKLMEVDPITGKLMTPPGTKRTG